MSKAKSTRNAAFFGAMMFTFMFLWECNQKHIFSSISLIFMILGSFKYASQMNDLMLMEKEEELENLLKEAYQLGDYQLASDLTQKLNVVRSKLL
jgi:hypothetical protein